ncbi:MAG: gliding motility-associated C-terminal domain-containing protein, partial [Lewinella sp.]|nr:gliding motility-associated C-terminal domain-containing protein [Lewinella sp.]
MADPVATPSVTTWYHCEIIFPDGCSLTDSIRVRVHEPMTVEVNEVICTGETYAGYTESGDYTDLLSSQYGCDSTRILHLTVEDAPLQEEIRTICLGESYAGYTESGTYQDHLPTPDGCDTLRTLHLEVTSPRLTELATQPASCALDDGAVFLTVSGGTGAQAWSLNGRPLAPAAVIDGLPAGSYSLVITDELGCQLDTTLLIEPARCPIYVPNAFSPDGDGVNDDFRIHAWADLALTVRRYEIYDRWGGLIYRAEDFPVHGAGPWWDGRYHGEPLPVSTYVYLIEVIYPDGVVETLTGDVTVLP